MNLTKYLGYTGLLASLLVGLGEFYLHYSSNILDPGNRYDFFIHVSDSHLIFGHFLAVFCMPFYFAGYIHIYRMLRSGSEILARVVLYLGFLAFSIGAVWIGSRGFLGSIVHLKNEIPPETYSGIIKNYDDYLEVLVRVLRVVIALLSVVFSYIILKGGTYYKKWMALINPIFILIILASAGTLFPVFGRYILPVLMNVTHFIIFGLSLFQMHQYKSNA